MPCCAVALSKSCATHSTILQRMIDADKVMTLCEVGCCSDIMLVLEKSKMLLGIDDIRTVSRKFLAHVFATLAVG